MHKDNTSWMDRDFAELRDRARKGGLELKRSGRSHGQEYRLIFAGTSNVAYASERLDNCRGFLAYRPDLQGSHAAAMAV